MSNTPAVQETASVNTFAQKPTFIIHVGKGLGRFHELPENDVRRKLESLAWKGIRAALSDADYQHINPVMLVSPEAWRNEQDAVREVMKKFSAVRQLGGTALTVVTFSQNVLSGILDAVVQVKFHDEVAVCVHSEKEGDVTVHRMNDDGVLQDWPYGCLQALLSEDDLEPFDFAALRKRVDLINGKK